MKPLGYGTLLLIVFHSSGGAQDRPGEQEILQAFIHCPEIIAAQKSLEGLAKSEVPRIVFTNSLCGVAGCQASVLVAQKFERRKADPMTTHILGMVYVGTKGEIERVDRVELVPFKSLPEPQKGLQDR